MHGVDFRFFDLILNHGISLGNTREENRTIFAQFLQITLYVVIIISLLYVFWLCIYCELSFQLNLYEYITVIIIKLIINHTYYQSPLYAAHNIECTMLTPSNSIYTGSYYMVGDYQYWI